MTATDVYKLYDPEWNLVYVGISQDARLRFRQHRKRWWWAQVHHIVVARYSTRWIAEVLEAHSIRDEDPMVNIQPGASWARRVVFAKETEPWDYEIGYAEFPASEYQERNWFENPQHQAGVLAL